MRKKLLVIIFLLGLSIALLGNPSPSAAGTIIVDGNCTLVDAIIAANTDAPSGQCPAGSGDDVISLTVDVQFTEAYPGSTNIGGGQAALPDITTNITIEGNGHIVNGNGPNVGRMTFVASGSTLTVNNVVLDEFSISITSGSVKGAVLYVDSTASVFFTDVNILETFLASGHNGGSAQGGVIFNEGVFHGERLFISDFYGYGYDGASSDGGAFYNTGTLTLADSTITLGGITGYNEISLIHKGGAIYSNGILNVEKSLFASVGVSSSSDIGEAYGGAIAAEGTTTISNSTFSRTGAESFAGNTSGGAIVVNTTDTVTISHSTFTNNKITGTQGEVIYVANGLPIIVGSIIASAGYAGCTLPCVATANDVPDCDGPISGTANLTKADDLSCNAVSSGNITLDDHVSTTLADNGGPTFTLALINIAGNPAVDANPGCGLLTDQRNFDRDTNCDIGAFELNGVPPTATLTFTPTDTLTPTNTFTPTFTDTPTDTVTPSPTATATSIDLAVSAVCDGPDLAVTIASGEASFEITASGGGNLPVTVGYGAHTILGPDKWDDLTITEQSGDGQSINLGQFKCRTDERPVPLMPAHRSRITNPFPTFSWTSISDANNYRVFVYDEADPGLRTVDIRQNSGGPTTMMLSTPLPVDRLFWRVRGRQNRVWSLWSIRFTLFIDPPTAQENVVTPVPTIQLDGPTSTPVPTIGVPDGGLTPVPTLIQPPNSR